MDRVSSFEPGSAVGWAPVARQSAHELVIRRIEEQVIAGTLRVGDALPPERDLAARLEVSRSAVREAIRTLEGYGVLRSAVGAGRNAGTFVSALPSAALTRLLRLHVALANFEMDDVIDTRVMLERSSAHVASGRVESIDVEAIRDILDQMDTPGIGRSEFNDLDTAFHVAIAEAGGNRLMADMTIAIRDSMRLPILRGLEQLGDWGALAVELRREHRGILAAIEDGEGDLAAELVEQHIRTAYDRLPALHVRDARAS